MFQHGKIIIAQPLVLEPKHQRIAGRSQIQFALAFDADEWIGPSAAKVIEHAADLRHGVFDRIFAFVIQRTHTPPLPTVDRRQRICESEAAARTPVAQSILTRHGRERAHPERRFAYFWKGGQRQFGRGLSDDFGITQDPIYRACVSG